MNIFLDFDPEVPGNSFPWPPRPSHTLSPQMVYRDRRLLPLCYRDNLDAYRPGQPSGMKEARISLGHTCCMYCSILPQVTAGLRIITSSLCPGHLWESQHCPMHASTAIKAAAQAVSSTLPWTSRGQMLTLQGWPLNIS